MDDELDLLLVLKKGLQKDLVVFIASEGGSAHKMLRENKYDVVLADFHMPNLNGMELLKEHAYSTKFIIMTGTYALEEECMQAGAAGFLRKPFTAQELIAQLIHTYDILDAPTEEGQDAEQTENAADSSSTNNTTGPDKAS